MKKICLIVTYNHNYETNIEKIEKLYKEKFDNIFHIVPFYTGNKQNVAKVYGSAYQFNEYYMHAVNKFVSDEYSHYIFVADDMIIHPKFNQDNILEHLKLDENTGYIDELNPITYKTFFKWDWSFCSIRSMLFNKNGCEYQRFIPSLEEAQKKFGKLGIPSKNITKKGFQQLQKFYVKDPDDYYRYDYCPLFKAVFKNVFIRFILGITKKLRLFPFDKSPKAKESFKQVFKNSGYELVAEILERTQKDDFIYPQVSSYADIFAIPHSKIHEFLHISSVFASARIFVEVAIPSAMALCLDKIVVNADIEYKNGTNEESFAIENDYSINKVIQNWDDKILFRHPIKLSKWKFDEVPTEAQKD